LFFEVIISSSSLSGLEGFSTAHEGGKSGFLSLFNFSGDNIVAFFEVLASLRVSNDAPLELEILDLLSGDLSSESSVFVGRNILRSNLN